MSTNIIRAENAGEIAISYPSYSGGGGSAAPVRAQFPEVSSLRKIVDPNAEHHREPEPTPEEILSQSRDEAEKVVNEAMERAGTIEQEAMEKAMADFERKVAEEVSHQTEQLRGKFAETIELISALEDEITKRVEHDLVGLALAISRKIIDREIENDREIVVNMLNKALEKLRERSLAEVHLNPEDLKYIESNRDRIAFRGTLELKPDPSISIGGCLIHTENGDIDARIESQFEELSNGLLDS
ncbi:MAG: FliH/SctL family protein [Pyrinomonadaceae bacterium]